MGWLTKNKTPKTSLFGLAHNLKRDNANPEQIYKLLRQFHLEILQEYKDGGVVEKVKIIAMEDENTCHHCLKTNGMILNLDTAIKEMPVPHRDCVNLNDGDDAGFICRCRYLPEID